MDDDNERWYHVIGIATDVDTNNLEYLEWENFEI